MKRWIVLLAICSLSFAAVSAQDEVKVVVPATKGANYALYAVSTGSSNGVTKAMR